MNNVGALSGALNSPPVNVQIEEELGRKGAGFMSGSHQHPDLLGEILILEPESGESLQDAQAGDGLAGG